MSDFISLPPSFCFTLRFCSYESTKDKLSLYHIWTFASRFAGVFRKSFYSHTIIGKLRAVCWGVSRKFYKKIVENFFPTTAYKKEVRYKSNFLFRFYYIVFYSVKLIKVKYGSSLILCALFGYPFCV